MVSLHGPGESLGDWEELQIGNHNMWAGPERCPDPQGLISIVRRQDLDSGTK